MKQQPQNSLCFPWKEDTFPLRASGNSGLCNEQIWGPDVRQSEKNGTIGKKTRAGEPGILWEGQTSLHSGPVTYLAGCTTGERGKKKNSRSNPNAKKPQK